MAIASRRQAARHGPGRLVVDGQDATVVRKATFAVRRQERALHRLLAIAGESDDAALQERRDAWQVAGKRVTWQERFGPDQGSARRARRRAGVWDPARCAARSCGPMRR